MKGGRGREEQVIAEARFYIVMVWRQAMVLYLVKQTNNRGIGETTAKQRSTSR